MVTVWLGMFCDFVDGLQVVDFWFENWFDSLDLKCFFLFWLQFSLVWDLFAMFDSFGNVF